jgi:signal transduction histidine kinase
LKHFELFLSLLISNGYGKQVPITFDLSPDVCDAVITDEEWLWQMLLNLLTNACKYTDRGEILVRVKTIDKASASALANLSNRPAPLTTSSETLLFEVLDTGKACLRVVAFSGRM